MQINVVHIKNFGDRSKMISPGELYVYCGRPSRLSNPFIMHQESDRDTVISKFKDNLPKKDIDELAQYCKEKKIHTLHLGCYCAPEKCHCDIIKSELESEDEVDSSPDSTLKYILLDPKSFFFSSICTNATSKNLWRIDDLILAIKKTASLEKYAPEVFRKLARKESRVLDLIAQEIAGCLFVSGSIKKDIDKRTASILYGQMDSILSIPFAKALEFGIFEVSNTATKNRNKKLSMEEIEAKYDPYCDEIVEMRYNGFGMTMHEIVRDLKSECGLSDAKVAELGIWFRNKEHESSQFWKHLEDDDE